MLVPRLIAFVFCVHFLPVSGQLPEDSGLEYPYDSLQFPVQIEHWKGPQNKLGCPPPQEEKRTIYQVLSDDPRFSRLVKVVDLIDDVVSLLNDTSAGITFFATPDSALRPPAKGHPKPPHPEALHHISLQAHYPQRLGQYDLQEVISLLENLEISPLDNSERNKRKVFLKKILRAILAYHILPTNVDPQEIVENTTYATNLTLSDGSLGGQPLRIKVDKPLLPPILRINLYSMVIRSGIARNGIFYVINHPLLPPPSIFQELFNFPGPYSILTSALQRTGLTNNLDLRHVPGSDGKKGSLEGATAVTIFAPTNHAFTTLPLRLRLFLFSPFGEHILKKLLQFHILPDLVLHSEYLYNATSDATVQDLPHEDAWTEHLDMPEIEEWIAGCPGSEEVRFPEPAPKDNTDGSGLSEESQNLEQLRKVAHHYTTADDSIHRMHRFPAQLSTPLPPPPDHRFPHGQNCPRHPSSLPCSTRCVSRSPFKPGPRAQEMLNHHLHSYWPSFSPPHPDEHPRSSSCQHACSFVSQFGGPNPLHPIEMPGPLPWGSPSQCQRPQSFPRPHFPRPTPIFARNLTLPTLLTNHSLHVHIAKFNITLPIPGPRKPSRIVNKFFVNGQHVAVADVVGRNGAVHIIEKLLNPRAPSQQAPRRKGEDDHPAEGDEAAANEGWEDWEEWLPQWALEN